MVREVDGCEGGGAGPTTLRRFSPESGLVERSPSSSRERFARCGGNDGPIGMVEVCGRVGVNVQWWRLSCRQAVTLGGALTLALGRRDRRTAGACVEALTMLAPLPRA